MHRWQGLQRSRLVLQDNVERVDDTGAMRRYVSTANVEGYGECVAYM